ncbi:MAG: bifunctional serine/threonine-protein kinase/formylglycine-generating enzyme family protein [Myxococcota bacterium]|nr:bifunctional serine/threonine-protein kinase/formylglycine-generating enzyme family protein [Myxococcota bacterium]
MNLDDLPAAAGRYEDLGVIGVGSVGEVRRVRDRLLGRVMAMKLIHIERFRHHTVQSQLIAEAQRLAQLQHPGIVSVHDIGRTVDGRVFFTMPEVRGQPLKAHLDRRALGQEGALSLRTLVSVLHNACEAVGYAHAQGVLHRDLKPSNIVRGDFGEVLVMGWNLARPLTPDRRASARIAPSSAIGAQTGPIRGTLAYVAPERITGRLDQPSARSDVYALGAILYDLLSSRPPDSSSDPKAVAAAVRGDPPLPHAAPAGLAAICWTALARQPTDRYPNAHAMAEALSAWLEERPEQEKARSIVQHAHTLFPRAARLRHRAQQLRAAARDHLDSAPTWSDEEEKLDGWEWEDTADALELEAALADQQAEHLLYTALNHDPRNSNAHAALAERYRQQHVVAEAAGLTIETRRLALRLEGHLAALDTGAPQRIRGESYLSGYGSLTLQTDPPGAEVLLYRDVQQQRRSRAVLSRVLGYTPLIEVPLAMGSYLLEIRALHCATVRYPVRILRQGRCTGIPPGATLPMPISLPASEGVAPDEVIVPAGWFTTGSDPLIQPAAREVWVDGFIIQRHPITNRQYLCFLNALCEAGRGEQAAAFAPQEAGRLMVERTRDGRFALPARSRWGEDCPVVLIDWIAARAYADWLAVQTGQGWRLPLSLEWEKAARGVDGRTFPWGRFLDPSWCCIRTSHPDAPSIVPIHRFPSDISPYGVRGMGGNVRDWCLDAWSEHGPRIQEDRAMPSEGIGAPLISVRGGSWYSLPEQARVARPLRLAPGARSSDVGFRLVRTYA